MPEVDYSRLGKTRKPSRYWMYNIAIGGGMMAIVLGLGSVGSLLYESQGLRTEAARLKTALESFQDVGPASEQSAEDQTTADAVDGRNDEIHKQDLAAQISMARSAEDQLAATWAQVVFSFAGIVGLIVTLNVTKGAVRVASATRRDANTQGRRQLRAYLGVESIDLDFSSLMNPNYRPAENLQPGQYAKDIIVLDVKNYGQTPANQVRTWAMWRLTPVGSAIPNDFELEEFDIDGSNDAKNITSRRSLHPGQIYKSRIPVWDATNFISAENHQAHLIIYGQIRYDDIFGISRVTKFCYLYEPGLAQGHRFTAYSFYNEAD